MNFERALLEGSAGNGPPKDVSASELFLRLADVERPTELLDFPRDGKNGQPIFQYRMRVLTAQEIDIASANAERHARKLLRDKVDYSKDEIRDMRAETWREIYDNSRIIELLYLACRDPNDVNKPLFDGPSRIHRLLTLDEITALFLAYQAVQQRFGPLWRILSDEELEAWISKLTAGVGAYPLSDLAHGQLVQLCVSLAYRAQQLKTDTGLFGSQPSDGATDISQSQDIE